MSEMTSRLVALAAIVGLQTATHAAPGYTFIKLVDHVDGNYSQRSFSCASINESGDVAFKASRSAPDGLSTWDVIARVSRTGVITTIVEDPDKTQFQFFGNTVSINDSGQTSFGAFRSNDDPRDHSRGRDLTGDDRLHRGSVRRVRLRYSAQ